MQDIPPNFAAQPNKLGAVFDGGKYAILCFEMQDGRWRYVLYAEHGRKLKRGKRRKPIATVDVAKPLGT